MRFVYVLEDDPKFIKEITEALLVVDPLIQVRQFQTLEMFATWIKLVMTSGKAAIPRGGLVPEGFQMAAVSEGEDCVLQVVISKVEFLGARQLGLMKKTRDLFIKYKVCTAEDPTAFVLTAFEDPAFKVTELKDRILSNILMKPFDRLILQQHLTFALDGRHPPSKHAVAPYKTSAIIEILKTVEMDSLSQAGFSSTSNREIPLGSVAKYYGKIFTSERQRSVIAKVIGCKPHPQKPSEFLITVSFFGLDPTQIANMRRFLIEHKDKAIPSPVQITSDKSQQSVGIVFVEDRDDVFVTLEPTLRRKIKNARIVRYRSLKELLLEVDSKLDGSGPAPKPFTDVTSVLVDADAKGKVTKIPSAGAKFAGQPLTVGANLAAFVRESDRAGFLAWLASPQGVFVSAWSFGEQIFIMKMTFLKDREFSIEEASALEKEDYGRQKSQIAKGVDFVFISHRFAGPERLDLWSEILGRLRTITGNSNLRTIVLSAQNYSDEEERRMAKTFDDLNFLPIERVYVLQKMILMNPNIEILEDPIEIITIPHQETIRSARPAQIEELSEAGLVMKYERSVSVGSFREFVLWQPYEIGAPEINATCNFSEPGATAGEWKLHFVFFGMKDILLKAIRNWILENYVRSKEKG